MLMKKQVQVAGPYFFPKIASLSVILLDSKFKFAIYFSINFATKSFSAFPS